MWKNRDDYLIKDDRGRWINTEFPPESFTMYPMNSGYRNANMEMLYYQFAVMYYDLKIEYDGKRYIALVDDDGAVMCDGEYNEISDTYPTANDLIKLFMFPDGSRLTELVNKTDRIFIDIM